MLRLIKIVGNINLRASICSKSDFRSIDQYLDQLGLVYGNLPEWALTIC